MFLSISSSKEGFFVISGLLLAESSEKSTSGDDSNGTERGASVEIGVRSVVLGGLGGLHQCHSGGASGGASGAVSESDLGGVNNALGEVTSGVDDISDELLASIIERVLDFSVEVFVLSGESLDDLLDSLLVGFEVHLELRKHGIKLFLLWDGDGDVSLSGISGILHDSLSDHVSDAVGFHVEHLALNKASKRSTVDGDGVENKVLEFLGGLLLNFHLSLAPSLVSGSKIGYEGLKA